MSLIDYNVYGSISSRKIKNIKEKLFLIQKPLKKKMFYHKRI